MRRKTVFLLGLACVLVCCFSCAYASVESRLDEVFARNSTLGACVAVFQNGEITFTHTYGALCPGGEAVTEDTLFQVGSISKMVANIGLMQLLDEKQIALDTPVGDVLGFTVRHPRYREEITLRQVMTHTAGLRDGNFYQKAIAGRTEKLETLFSSQAKAVFWHYKQPGMERRYSNFGGGLIGSMMETLSGETIDDYMQKHVFQPLGITAAYQIRRLDESLPAADIYHMPSQKIGKRLRDDQELFTEADAQTHYAVTAGKLTISAPDLCKILIALCDGGVYQNARILPESVVSEMLTPQNFRGSVQCETGHGLFMNIHTDVQVEGRTLYGHGGKAYGMLCAAYFDPADRTGVVMLTNGCKDRATPGGVGALGNEILTLCYREIIEPAHETLDPFAVQ